ncbi:MAG: MBL fold metallo-hydrolase [Gammaproteobacteria bacterium]|nr:MBL fold metallo-hydrolase [Gammaproteobacteria bacterium]
MNTAILINPSARLSTVLTLFACLAMTDAAISAEANDPHQVGSLRITILSTMLAEQGIGEWGFAALVEADGHRILFDTGNYPDTVLRNAAALGIDLADVEEVVLSHNHSDHTGGLVALRTELVKKNPAALSRAHVGRGIFWERLGRPSSYVQMASRRQDYVALGGSVIEHDTVTEIHPGIWLTGPVPRVHPERNWGGANRPVPRQVQSPDGPVEDNIPESMSMVIHTPRGLVVLSGCGHAGIVNTLEYAQKAVSPVPVHAAIGGFHLADANEDTLNWTAQKLVGIGVDNFVGAHCTGLEPVYRFRQLVDLNRENAVVGAVGATFTLDGGIDPLRIAR